MHVQAELKVAEYIEQIQNFSSSRGVLTNALDLEDGNSYGFLNEFHTQTPYSFQHLSPGWLKYDKSYAANISTSQIRLLIIFPDGKIPNAVWILTINKISNQIVLGTPSLPIYPPMLREGLSVKQAKKITEFCLEIGNFIASISNLNYWQSTEYMELNSGLSMWYSHSKMRATQSQMDTYLFVNLSLGEDTLWTRIRNSNRTKINAGLKRWNHEIYLGIDDQKWSEFRLLHHEVAGRVTRSIETWEIQLAMIREDKAFAIFLRNDINELVGGILISHTDVDSLYVTGVYLRTIGDPTLGHLAQWLGIQELIRRNVSWYNLGPRPYPSLESVVDDKELSIANFKDGYATHLVPKIVYTHPVTGLQGVETEN
jgi:FemAB family protein